MEDTSLSALMVWFKGFYGRGNYKILLLRQVNYINLRRRYPSGVLVVKLKACRPGRRAASGLFPRRLCAFCPCIAFRW